ncbi:LPS-assembly lipoprotein [Yoonia tamlensis]|uniref:LPS-assembly lipoprotein n=1 Tax=Yoonia tamlensis TaxID=390270 RepID=A0A1I6HMC2_9RHOB|nr:LPS assembly lipoprotein LptE [Yoonia tamlensis]SFR55592.1 LPS-assembly lipoprotein [Yoonia tamlensis]
MSSNLPSRRFAILGLLALGGCGFAPVYGNGTGLRGLIAFETDETVAGYRFGAQLEERLGLATAPRYLLRVTQTRAQRSAAIAEDGDTTRYNVTGTARWTLTDSASSEEVAQGQVDAFTSYSATGSTVATQTATVDADARLSVILADMVVDRLLILEPQLTP